MSFSQAGGPEPILNIPAGTLPDGSVTAAKLAAGAAFGNLTGMTGIGNSLVLSTSPTFTGQPIVTPTVPDWVHFNTLYPGFIVNLGGLPTNAMDASAAGAQPMAAAIIGAIDIPSTIAVNPAFVQTGVSGYARTASPIAVAVGLFGVGMANAANTAGWGLNTIATNTPFTVPPTQTGKNNVVSYSIEADVNIMKLPGGGTPAGTVRGLAVFSGSEVVPSLGSYCIEIGPFTQTSSLMTSVVWNAAMVVDQAPNLDAILLQPKGWGTGVPAGVSTPGFTKTIGSQSISFVSCDSANGPGSNNATAATWAATSGGQITFTTSAPHGLAPGAIITSFGFTPAGYNNVFVTQAGTTGSTIVVTNTANPGVETVLGIITASGNFHVAKIASDPTGNIIMTPSAGSLTVLTDGSGNTQFFSGSIGTQVNGLLNVTGDVTGLPSTAAFATPPTVHFYNTAGSVNRVVIDAIANAAAITFRRADGTLGNPTALVINDAIGNISFNGFGTSYPASAGAQISAAAAENWTGSNQGTFINILTTPTGGSTTAAIAVRVEPGGGLTAAQSYATPPGGTANLGFMLGTAKIGLFFGSGAPTFAAPANSLYMRTDGSTTTTRLYVNTTGSTTWATVTTSA